MAVTQDGDQLFGINVASFSSMIVESFSLTTPSNRVDLDDGDGEPLGSTVVPQRQEASLTVQMGSADSPPAIGLEVSYGSFSIMVTGVDLTETQGDYRRYSITGYVKTNS
jgi:hypothetical protein